MVTRRCSRARKWPWLGCGCEAEVRLADAPESESVVAQSLLWKHWPCFFLSRVVTAKVLHRSWRGGLESRDGALSA